MTRKEFLEKKGWNDKQAKKLIEVFWNFRYWKETKSHPISNYELYCDKPLHEVIAEYNKAVKHSPFTGTLHDFLELDANEESVQKVFN